MNAFKPEMTATAEAARLTDVDRRTPTIDPGVHTFLFADVGLELNGMMLSVLSTFSRQNLDPWEEAAALSRLSRKAARDRLARIIVDLPDGLWSMPVATAIAGRLIPLLPAHAATPPKAGQRPMGLHGTWHLYRLLILMAAVLVGLTLNRMSHQTSVPTASVAAPAATASAPPTGTR